MIGLSMHGMSNEQTGELIGVGVGPGGEGLISVAALEALRSCGHIFAPKAGSTEESLALHCLRGLDFGEGDVEEVTFAMERDRTKLSVHYREFGERVAGLLREGTNVGYLTIGDPLTYSTYGYLIAALLAAYPAARHRTFPGVNSFTAVAAAFDWPLGEGKERVLILPCPDGLEALRADIESHDVVVLMKIGKRLAQVLELLHEMKIAEHCVLGKRVGLEDEVLCGIEDIASSGEKDLGYLSTMLIRKESRAVRHEGGAA